MRRTIYIVLLALLAAVPLGAAQLMLVQDGFSSGSGRMNAHDFTLEQAAGFPFGGIATSGSFIEAGGYYPIGTVASGVEISDQNTVSATAALPKILTLQRPYPNPGHEATIRFGLPRATRVSLRIYNVLGQEVAALASGDQNAGWYTVRWSGRDKASRRVAAGVYLLRLNTADKSLTQKLTILR
jgi:hypothetical protein